MRRHTYQVRDDLLSHLQRSQSRPTPRSENTSTYSADIENGAFAPSLDRPVKHPASDSRSNFFVSHFCVSVIYRFGEP